SYKMAARDGSFSFDFGGKYDNIITNKILIATLGDGRKLEVEFSEKDHETMVIERFEAESENSIELQKQGWQMILNNFRKYAESL
ncbi:MAG: SRPBCC domain-containing protein, partial [Saprospiraceae bacterium]